MKSQAKRHEHKPAQKKDEFREKAKAGLKSHNKAITDAHLKVFDGMVDFLLKLFESNGKGGKHDAYSLAKEFVIKLTKMRVSDHGKTEKRPLSREEIESFEIIAQTAFSFYKSKGMKNLGSHGFKGAKNEGDAFTMAFTSAQKIFESEGKKLYEN